MQQTTNTGPGLTILTDPLAHGSYLIPQTLRVIARSIRNGLRQPEKKLNRSAYRGHFAVTRSLVEGLRKADLPFNYNPRSVREVAKTVVVLAGVRTLRQAIELKRRGVIEKLFAGPNIIVFSSDADCIIGSPEIDAVITPCNWVIDMYVEDIPHLEGKCFAWPAGVDTEYWQPQPNIARRKILIFEKQSKGPVEPIDPYVHHLRENGYAVSILKYGSYNHVEFLKELQHAQLMIGFSTGESQGIAWAEAWATDVPTLLWRNTSNIHRNRRYRCSTAPYLQPENGAFFDDFDDFKRQFSSWESNPNQFSPRAWTLGHMSDQVCASLLYDKVFAC